MSIRFLFLFLYLAYALSSGSLSTQGSGVPIKQASGWDPNGLTSVSPLPPPTVETGGGLDPDGRK